MTNPDPVSLESVARNDDSINMRPVPIAALSMLVVRRIRFILVSAVIVAIVVVASLIARGNQYTADSSFVIQGKAGRSGLSGIAAQFGITVPTSDATESPLFFVDLARTRPILAVVADSAPSVLNGLSLESLFKVGVGSTQHRRTEALKKFNDALGGTVSAKTSIVELTLTTRDPNASARLLALLIRTVDRFNRASQQDQAGAQRRFAEERVKATLQDLRSAEDRLQTFQLRNRATGSPTLALDEGRLVRDVSAAQALYSTLQQTMETARIEELRNTPVIQVLEAPVAPLDPDPHHLARYAVVGGIFGGLLGAIFVLVTQVANVRNISDREARAELSSALQAMWRRGNS